MFAISIFQGRLKPGRMLLVDTKQKVFLKDELIKANLASKRPVQIWLKEVTQEISKNLRKLD